MKSRILFIITLLVIEIATVRSQELQWSKVVGSEGEEYSLNHLQDKSGNIYISGKTTGAFAGSNKGMNDGYVIKLDKFANILWSCQFGTNSEDDVQWSAIDDAGNIYITGFTYGSLGSPNAGREDIFLVKYNPMGEAEWQKQFGTDSSDVAKGICTDKKGFIYITGYTNGKLGETQIGKRDAFIMKLDNKGNIVQTKQFGTPEDDFGYSLTPGKNDGLYLCGTTWGSISGKNKGFVDSFTGRFTTDLSNQWYQQFGSEGFDIALVVHTDSQDNLYIGGSTSGNLAGTQAGNGDCFLVKQDSKGNIAWSRQFGTGNNDGVRGIDVTDKVIISGIMNLPPEKAFIQIYDFEGSLKWEKTFETSTPQAGTSGKDVIADKKGFTHLGLTGSDLFGPLKGGHDMFLLKYTW